MSEPGRPDPRHPSPLNETLDALASPASRASLAVDVYWPKWRSPWWRLSLLDEMGMLDRAPEGAFDALARAVLAVPERRFALTPDVDDPQAFCHCALGNFLRMLGGSSHPAKGEFGWALDWFVEYQMADGGYNCDESAYAVKGECPSSMVATIAALEALTGQPRHEQTARRAAACILRRELRHGSDTQHNAAERASAARWAELAFPRFYHYDLLRGFEAVVRWATVHDERLPWAAIEPVWSALSRRFPEAVVHAERRAYEGHTSRLPDGTRVPAESFALLEAVSAPGPSSFLTERWRRSRAELEALRARGSIVT
jgi:hypothetical protein